MDCGRPLTAGLESLGGAEAGLAEEADMGLAPLPNMGRWVGGALSLVICGRWLETGEWIA